MQTTPQRPSAARPPVQAGAAQPVPRERAHAAGRPHVFRSLTLRPDEFRDIVAKGR